MSPAATGTRSSSRIRIALVDVWHQKPSLIFSPSSPFSTRLFRLYNILNSCRARGLTILISWYDTPPALSTHQSNGSEQLERSTDWQLRRSVPRLDVYLSVCFVWFSIVMENRVRQMDRYIGHFHHLGRCLPSFCSLWVWTCFLCVIAVDVQRLWQSWTWSDNTKAKIEHRQIGYHQLYIYSVTCSRFHNLAMRFFSSSPKKFFFCISTSIVFFVLLFLLFPGGRQDSLCCLCICTVFFLERRNCQCRGLLQLWCPIGLK